MENGASGREEYRQWLAPYLSAWARHNIHFGIAGGWNALQKYRGCFHAACVDIHVGSGSGFLRVPRVLPPECDLTVAVLSDVMTYRFPYRYGDATRRGTVNGHFLDTGLLQEQLLPCMRDLGQRVKMILLPVQHIYRTENVLFAAFIDRLARFLDVMPHTCRYGVAMCNREYLLPEYFACLHERNIAHVLNASPAMPSVLDQVQLPHALTTDVAVVRTTLNMIPELQLGIVETVRRCIDEHRTLYIDIDEDEEHSMLSSLAVLMEMLNSDLARLSPIKQKAA